MHCSLPYPLSITGAISFAVHGALTPCPSNNLANPSSLHCTIILLSKSNPSKSCLFAWYPHLNSPRQTEANHLHMYSTPEKKPANPLYMHATHIPLSRNIPSKSLFYAKSRNFTLYDEPQKIVAVCMVLRPYFVEKPCTHPSLCMGPKPCPIVRDWTKSFLNEWYHL